MRSLIIMSLLIFTQEAFAGFIEVRGSASGYLYDGETDDDARALVEALKLRADQDAKTKCRSWHDFERVSEYSIDWRRSHPGYVYGWRAFVEADYICGQIDH